MIERNIFINWLISFYKIDLPFNDFGSKHSDYTASLYAVNRFYSVD
jgi:hypothetical protein